MGLQTTVIVAQLVLAGALGVEHTDLARSGESVDDPAQLVQQLGDRSFSVRRHATAQLIELGIDSMEALEGGLESQDREIRFRCRHVFEIVRKEDFRHRLRAFAAGLEAPETYGLPGWLPFAKEVGAGPKARALFVEMQRAESKLLAALEENPDKIGEILTQRVALLQSTRALGGDRKRPSLGAIASILFVLNIRDVKLPMMMTQSIGSFFRYPSFAMAIENGPQRELLRGMLGTWIENTAGWDAHYAMTLAMQYNMPVGLIPARRILQGKIQQPNSTHFTGYALFTVARFGDMSDYPLVESLLDNETPYGGTIAVPGKNKLQTQIRDIALATLVQLAKLNHKDFGFTRYRVHPSYVFNTSSLAFPSDEAREAAITKWRKFREEM